MAIYRVWHGGSNTAPYDTWAKAATTEQTAQTAASAGDTIWRASDHLETDTASLVITRAGTNVSPNNIISVDRTDDSYLKATSAQIQRTSVGDISLVGSAHEFGVFYEVGDDLILNTTGDGYILEDSNIKLTGGNSTVNIGSSTGRTKNKFLGVDIDFTSSGDGFLVSNNTDFEWHGGTLSFAGTQPSVLFPDGGRNTSLLLNRVNMASITSLLFDLNSADSITKVRIANCVVSSGVSVYNSIGRPGTELELIGADDTTGNELYRYLKATYYGEITQDDITFVTGEDGDGTNITSLKMVTNANALEYSRALVSARIAVWVDSTGSKTFKIPILTDGVTLQNDEIWSQLEYLGSSANTQLSVATDRMVDILATPANHGTDSTTWTESLTTPTKQELSVTATIGRVGLAYITVHFAKPSSTVYVGRKVVVT